MPIGAIRFENFKVFTQATLPLGRATLIIGPNGTGKSTSLFALELLAAASRNITVSPVNGFRSIGASGDVKIVVEWTEPRAETVFIFQSAPGQPPLKIGGDLNRAKILNEARVFSFDHDSIAAPVSLNPAFELEKSGKNLAYVLTKLQDHTPERFEALNKDLARWLPEFDRILLDTPTPNIRAFYLRTTEGNLRMPAASLSQGTLFSLALLTLCHLPSPPAIIGIEDPDHGMHPRLLRDSLDAINRLSHPEDFGDKRAPVQVIMTTHSPYFVDLFKDHLDDVLILEKVGHWSNFRRLGEIPNVREILSDSHLGETWYNGVFGGVPLQT